MAGTLLSAVMASEAANKCATLVNMFDAGRLGLSAEPTVVRAVDETEQLSAGCDCVHVHKSIKAPATFSASVRLPSSV